MFWSSVPCKVICSLSRSVLEKFLKIMGAHECEGTGEVEGEIKGKEVSVCGSDGIFCDCECE